LYVVRSPYPAALIKSIDVEAAKAAPGVRLVLTPDDPDLERLGTFTSRVRRKAPNGEPNFEPPYRVLTKYKAQFVGDAVVAIIADTLDQAKDAAELVEIDWEIVPAVTETRVAAEKGAAQ